MAQKVLVREKGLVPYPQGLRLQEEARDEVLRGLLDGVILALRHPPTLTIGRRALVDEVLISRIYRRAIGVDLYYVERGGGATYHGPDQAVVYPVVHLERLGLGVRDLLGCIADATIAYLASEGVEASWDPTRPGVYVGGAKIASVGMLVSRGVTMHGVAVNIGPEVAGFGLIDPCNSPGLAVTSLASVSGRHPNPDEASRTLAGLVADRLRDASRSGTMKTAFTTRRSPGGWD